MTGPASLSRRGGRQRRLLATALLFGRTPRIHRLLPATAAPPHKARRSAPRPAIVIADLRNGAPAKLHRPQNCTSRQRGKAEAEVGTAIDVTATAFTSLKVDYCNVPSISQLFQT